MTSLAVYRCELIHNTTLNTAVVMLCALTDTGKLKLLDAEVIEFVECEGKSTLKGCRR